MMISKESNQFLASRYVLKYLVETSELWDVNGVPSGGRLRVATISRVE